MTIKDVAREAGVSVATVSRALNGQANVTPQTRQRVAEIAARLRFVPSQAARNLIARRTRAVGVLLPALHGEYFSELIRGIDGAARALGLHLLFSGSHGDAKEAAAALRAMNGRVDGLLVMSPHVDADFLWGNVPAHVPVVLMNTHGANDRQHLSFAVDNLGGAQAMVRHLVDRGHRRIAFVAGPEGNFEAQERLAGYRSALAECLPRAFEQVLPGDFDQASGVQAGRQIVARDDRPTAVFACNDMMAIGCLAAFREAGLQVPRDIAVAGFDDTPLARHAQPGLTTVSARICELGSLAMERLAAAIETPDAIAPQHVTLAAQIVIRESTAT